MTIDVHEKWHVQATGNMTLALLSPSNERILVVDMLARQTIRAGDGGLRLAKTYNDLSLLSRIPDLLVGADTQHRGIPRPDAGTSPLPWSVVSDLERRRLCVKDRNGRVIADRTFPASEPVARVASLFAMVHDGVEVLNTTTVLSSGQVSDRPETLDRKVSKGCESTGFEETCRSGERRGQETLAEHIRAKYGCSINLAAQAAC
ncbi:MAG: hypothetical protein GW802_11735 [Armatimonadetes bacterium]|nr:hypothetical protein [Armatimonadota bacterium]